AATEKARQAAEEAAVMAARRKNFLESMALPLTLIFSPRKTGRGERQRWRLSLLPVFHGKKVPEGG
ncbi:hypothetical protein, partial [Mesorhizobium sp.]